jgi:ferredoxin-NADP reductase
VDFTPDHFKLWLEPAEPFTFAPGQYCTIGVEGIERPYSIVSSPREPLI